jgi:lysine 2,3-aminomutase
MKYLQGWMSGITVPRYAVNIEGGGGKVLLMPSGHDTLNLEVQIDDKISESSATVVTWDGKEMVNYEALGRSTKKEFDEAVKLMDKFIGRKGVFLPKVIIVDEEGRIVETTNRTKLPAIENSRKAELLEYEMFNIEMPLTNPADIEDKLEIKFQKSKYFKNQK